MEHGLVPCVRVTHEAVVAEAALAVHRPERTHHQLGVVIRVEAEAVDHIRHHLHLRHHKAHPRAVAAEDRPVLDQDLVAVHEEAEVAS